VPAGTELCTRGADDLDEPTGLTAGVRGVLKGCATPGFEVAAGAPEAARGVAVVAVSAVMGVEAREGVVVKAREKARVGVRRERQRVQIMVVDFLVWRGLWCGLAWYCYANCFPLLLYAFGVGSSRGSKSQSGLGSRRRRSGMRVWI
jgi:hypothetical protein